MQSLSRYCLWPVIVIFITCLLSNHSVNAQEQHPVNVKKDSLHAEQLFYRAWKIRYDNADSAMYYLNEAKKISQETGYPKGFIRFVRIYVPLIYNFQGDVHEAIQLCSQAIDTATRYNLRMELADSYMCMALVYQNMSLFQKSVEYYIKAQPILEELNDKQALSIFYSNISGCYFPLKMYRKSLEADEKAIRLSEEMKDTPTMAMTYLNAAVVLTKTGDFERAFSYYEKSFQFSNISGNSQFKCKALHNSADLLIHMAQYDNAITRADQGLKLAKHLQFPSGIALSQYALANANFHLLKFRIAEKFAIDGLSIAKENNLPEETQLLLEVLSKIEIGLGNIEKSEIYYQAYTKLTDSLFDINIAASIHGLETLYQSEKKQKEILQLQKDKQIQNLSLEQKATFNYFLLAIILAFLIAAFLTYRTIRSRNALVHKEALLQQQYIRELEKDKQLVAVDSMLKGQEDERSRLAKDLHDGLGGLLSGIKFSLGNIKENLIMTPDNMSVFDRSLDMIDTSIKELRRVAHNMMPEMLTKFGLDEALKEYCSTINSTMLVTVKYQSVGMDSRIEKSVEIIVYRIVQELLNNTMKHASATEVFVQLIKDENRLSIVVEDNGKGFDTSLANENKGAGWINIRSRVDYLKGQLDIHSEPGKGTLVNIEINQL